jgi:hypothetical protein
MNPAAERQDDKEHEITPPIESPEQAQERAAEQREREALRDILSLKGLDAGTALEVVATYDRKAMTDDMFEDVRLIASDYGLDFEGLDEKERQKLLTLYVATDKVLSAGGKAELGRAMNELMREELMDQALAGVERLKAGVFEAKDPEELKERFRGVLRMLHDLAGQIPPEVAENDKVWSKLYGQFRDAIEMKNKEGLVPQAAEALKGVVDEFEGEIEDEFAARELQRLAKSGKPHSVEHLMRDIYGRSAEEVEAVKARNRQDVANEIIRLREDPVVTVEQINKLYELNNRGLVPKSYARLREGIENITFGRRVGLAPEDLRAEMEALADRATALASKEMVRGMSDTSYELAAAKLHNDLLDIHPYNDRNGSTALLFLELVMSKKGYVPPLERQPDYYAHLRKTLGDNLLAVGLVAYEHFKMKYRPGYYEGETLSGERKKTYERYVDRHNKRYDEIVATRKRIQEQERSGRRKKST